MKEEEAMAGSKDRLLIEGKLFPNMFRFAMPILLMTLLQRLYHAADMIVVNYSGVAGAIGAIGTTGSMVTLFLCATGGFSVGADVLVARYIGARDEKRTETAVHTAVGAGLLFGLLGGLVGFLLCKPLLIAMGDEGRILDMAVLYSRIYFISIPFTTLTDIFKAILRAKGNTKTPLFVLMISGLFNVGMNFFFVLVLGMDVDGVAWATVLSNVVSTVWLMLILIKDEGWCHLNLKKIRIQKNMFRDMLSIGIPASLEDCLFCFSNMLIQSSIITMNNMICPGGSAVLDGSSAAANIEGFIGAANAAASNAVVTFTSQHLGAGKNDRLKKVRAEGLRVGLLLVCSMTALLYILRKPVLSLYISDELAYETAFIRISIMFINYPLMVHMDNFASFLRGIGKSALATVITLTGICGFRVLWLMIVFRHVSMTLETIFSSWPISWTLTAIVAYFVCRKQLRRLTAKTAVSD